MACSRAMEPELRVSTIVIRGKCCTQPNLTVPPTASQDSGPVRTVQAQHQLDVELTELVSNALDHRY